MQSIFINFNPKNVEIQSFLKRNQVNSFPPTDRTYFQLNLPKYELRWSKPPFSRLKRTRSIIFLSSNPAHAQTFSHDVYTTTFLRYFNGERAYWYRGMYYLGNRQLQTQYRHKHIQTIRKYVKYFRNKARTTTVGSYDSFATY